MDGFDMLHQSENWTMDDPELSMATEPPIQEATSSSDNNHIPSKRPRWSLIISAVLVLVIIGLSIHIVKLSASNQSDQASTDVMSQGENAPPTSRATAPSVLTSAPMSAPATAAPFQPSSIVSTLRPTFAPTELGMVTSVVQNLVGETILADESSPQSSALEWLLQTDHLHSDDEAAITQRFALVVADLSMHHRSSAQLAVAGVHECKWSGIACNADMLVEKINWPRLNLSGTIPAEIGLLSNLIDLDLGESGLRGRLPESLFQLTNLQSLRLQTNRLSGTLSESFSRLSKLESLFLGDNALHGPFPSGLGSRSTAARPLRRLSLHKNHLTGSIPTNLNLRKLAWLDLGYNQLTGRFPLDWIDSMPNLGSLYLDHNALSGIIPRNITWMGNSRIKQIVVNDNHFHGWFDARFTDTEGLFLQTLHINHNNFTSIGSDVCRRLIWKGGWLTSYRADCVICKCDRGCARCY